MNGFRMIEALKENSIKFYLFGKLYDSKMLNTTNNTRPSTTQMERTKFSTGCTVKCRPTPSINNNKKYANFFKASYSCNRNRNSYLNYEKDVRPHSSYTKCNSAHNVSINKNEYPFQTLVDSFKYMKPHGSYIENSDQSWKERKRSTFNDTAVNYESKMTTMLGKNPLNGTVYGKSITKMYRENTFIFHRQKRIAEYSDLSHIFAHNKDKKFEGTIKKSPQVFRRAEGQFTKYRNAMIRNGVNH